MKHYCPLPFNHLAIRPNGNVYPCCFFRWEETPADMTLDYPDLFNSHPFMKQIREDLREDKPIAGCSKCYEAEELTGKSMRLDYLADTKLGLSTTPPEKEELKYVDLSLSNVCNNKCRMCSYELSTSWYSDTKKLGVEIPRGLIKNGNPLEGYDLSKLTYIKMIGGEPLMEQEKFIDILKQCNLPELTILITTNTTVRPNAELQALLDQCKRIKWNFSVDAYGTLNDFLRKGSKWQEVADNLDWYINRYGKDTNVHAVVSIYNINTFYELNTYIKTRHPKSYISFVTADGPSWMMIANLPERVKETIKNKLEIENAKLPIPNFNVIIEDMMKPGDFYSFVHMDKRLNLIREEHWIEHNPELYELIKDEFDPFYASVDPTEPIYK